MNPGSLSTENDQAKAVRLYMGFEPGRLVMNNQLLVMKAKFYAGNPEDKDFKESFPIPVVFENKNVGRNGKLVLSASSAEQIMEITKQLRAATSERLSSFFMGDVQNVPQVILEVGSSDPNRLPIGYLLDSSQESSKDRMVVAFDPMEGSYSRRKPGVDYSAREGAATQTMLREELEVCSRYCYDLAGQVHSELSSSDGSGHKALADRIFEDTVYVYMESKLEKGTEPLLAFGQNCARSDMVESESDRFDPNRGHYTVPNGSYDFEFSLSKSVFTQALEPFLGQGESSEIEFYYENDEASAYVKVKAVGEFDSDISLVTSGLSSLRDSAEQSLIEYHIKEVESLEDALLPCEDVYKDAQSLYSQGS